MSKKIRILLLLLILLIVAMYTSSQRFAARSWVEPLRVVIYPLNAGASSEVENYISHLKIKDFSEINQFLQVQSRRYDLYLDPAIIIKLGASGSELPPQQRQSSSILSNVLWSLHMRYWAYRHSIANPTDYVQVNMYVIYHKLVFNQALKHSTGLQKGLIGVVHAFAASRQQQQNNVIIAHELLHTLGASDKYNRQGQPVYPIGYVTPNKVPLYPQHKAEIMAGRIPISAHQSKMPLSLAQCSVGKISANEINWEN